MKLCADFLAFVSAFFLAFPAWYFNKYAHLSARASRIKLNLPDPELAALFRDTKRELVDLRDEWRPWKAWFLHIGTAAGLLATLLTVVGSVLEWLHPPHVT
jgi:hypothetical protein